MSDRPAPRLDNVRSSRRRYRAFVEKYKRRQLDESLEASGDGKPGEDAAKAGGAKSFFAFRRGKRREYLRAYLRWLRPHRYAIGALFLFALLAAGLELVEPLFMRFIIDRILLNTGLD